MLSLQLLDAEKRRRERLARIKARCEEDLLYFVKTFWHVVDPTIAFIDGMPMQAIADHLMAVTDGEIKDLIINVPPGWSKSSFVSVFWPAWEWGPCGLPSQRYFNISYSVNITADCNRKFLRLISDPMYREMWGNKLWTYPLAKEGEGHVENNRTGWKIATSVGGSVMGRRGTKLLLDDLNDTKDVDSAAKLEEVRYFIREVMPTRLTNLEKDNIVLIQQRVHGSDATATLLEYGGDTFEHLMIPMEYDPLRHCMTGIGWQDPRGVDDDGNRLRGLFRDSKGNDAVRPGSPLAEAEGRIAWPERYSSATIDKQRTLLGPYGYAAQYQQTPQPRGGGIIKEDWWLPWTSPNYPDFITVVAALDTAVKENESNDYNALTVWGVFEEETKFGNRLRVILVDAWKVRCSLAELVLKVGATCRKHKVDTLLIEDKTRGHDVHHEIRRQYGSREWSTLLINPGAADKVSRLNAVSHLFSGDYKIDPETKLAAYSGGVVYAPVTQWAQEVINDVSAFPKIAHDDLVDTVSLAMSWLRSSGNAERDVEREEWERERSIFRKPEGELYDV